MVAQSTGLKRAATFTQCGATVGSIMIDDMNVSGSDTNCEIPIRASC